MSVNGKAKKERGSALDKAMRVLDALVDQPQSVGLPDLTARVGLPRQTVHRVLQQLEELGFVLRNPARDRYSIGPNLTDLALKTLHSANQSAPVRAVLQDLVDDIQETCNIGVLDRLELVYLERIECEWHLRVHLKAGSRVPAHATAGGKMLLSSLRPSLIANLLKTRPLKAFTEHTITDQTALTVALQDIRKQGCSLNNQEFALGLIAVAVPIADHTGRHVASLALQAPTSRLSMEKAVGHIPKLHAAAKKLADIWLSDSDGDVLAA